MRFHGQAEIDKIEFDSSQRQVILFKRTDAMDQTDYTTQLGHKSTVRGVGDTVGLRLVHLCSNSINVSLPEVDTKR